MSFESSSGANWRPQLNRVEAKSNTNNSDEQKAKQETFEKKEEAENVDEFLSTTKITSNEINVEENSPLVNFFVKIFQGIAVFFTFIGLQILKLFSLNNSSQE